MKNGLIIVGKELKQNNIFVSYLKREVENSIGIVDMILFISKNDETISTIIEKSTKSYDNLIIATQEGFELVGKILSTQTSDALEYKYNMLLPSKVTIIEENSYMVDNINVIKISSSKKIPKILAKVTNKKTLYMFATKDKSQRFEKLSLVFGVKLSGIQIIEGVWKYTLLTDEKSFERLIKECREIVTHMILLGDDLSTIISQRLIESKKSITFAESCTGGLIASELVKNSGVSSIFKGSIVSYANEIKSELVGVKEETLAKHGAVSSETIQEMLDGVMKKFDSDFAIAVSGVAGPDGGSDEKPVGTVYIGVKSKEKSSIIKKIQFFGDRIFIQQSTVLWALKLLLELDKKLFFKFMPKSLDK